MYDTLSDVMKQPTTNNAAYGMANRVKRSV